MITRTVTSKLKPAKVQKLATRSMAKKPLDQQYKVNMRRENIAALSYEKESAEIIKKSSKLVLIRHGNSMFNKLFHELEGPGYVVTPRYFDIYSDLSIIDSPLSQLGIEQCKSAARLAAEVEFDTIFVSPLRRAIETTLHIFKDHPNFLNMKFVIHPHIRENIMTAGDIPGDINKLVERFSLEFPSLNTSFFPRDFEGKIDELYYTRDMTPELSERIAGLSKQQADLILCQEIKETFPKSIERYHYTNGRVQGIKEFFRDFIMKGKSYFCSLVTSTFRNFISYPMVFEY